MAMLESVILLDNIVQVFALLDFYTLAFIIVVLLDGGRIGTAFIDVDQAGLSVSPDGFVQKTAPRFLIALGCQ
jgi:hypothetical protein